MKAKNLLAKIILIICITCSCQTQDSLKGYAQRLLEQSKPGIFAKQFVGNSVSLAPDTYLLKNLIALSKIWKHQDEFGGEDYIQNAEKVFMSGRFSGDCEDYSVLVMSLCRLRNIDAVFCLGKNSNTHTGHIWLEIPICLTKQYHNGIKNRINKLFSDTSCVRTRQGKVWLCLISSSDLKKYDLEFTVDAIGKLESIKDR